MIQFVMQMNTIGLSIVFQEFRRAEWSYSMPHYHPQTASDSLAFIQGTGLDIVLNYYGLMYDPDQLRSAFFSMVGDHSKLEGKGRPYRYFQDLQRKMPIDEYEEENGFQ